LTIRLNNKKNKSLLTIILARKGSRRILNKNLRKIGKNSLVETTIKFALKLKNYSDVILSTDDLRIIKIAKKYKVLVPGMRPKHLSGRYSSSLNVVKHVIKWYENEYKIDINGIILLQPTSPFRQLSPITKSIISFKKNKFNYVSISKNKDFKKNKLHINKNNFLELPNKNKVINCYTNGNFYILNSSKIKTSTLETLLETKTKGVMIKSKKISLDIDTEKDLKEARKYYN
jgi:N-acylneuraminate cytidylyltransferase